LPQVDLDSVRLGSPVARPSKIIGIGLNYKDHALETGAELPSEPKIFMKATSALCGVFDDVILPRGSEQTDYEVELAFVVARRASYVRRRDALDFVAGYTICNDYSEREFQKNRAGQFVKGKSADSFAPLGPFLVTADEFSPQDARLWCAVGGEMRQDSRTSEMVFDVPSLIENLSQYMSLLPGDVVTTGTPAGVGLGRKPPAFLQPSDVVTYGIEGIGEARQLVVPYQSPESLASGGRSFVG
jgi:2-keto-4-pentenoate hydratase/2-oxohepta-3-ene-1,7-dioic acid hydratase in catechol pathway